MNDLQKMIWELRNINELKSKGVINQKHSEAVVGLHSTLNTKLLEKLLIQLALEQGINPYTAIVFYGMVDAPINDDKAA